MKRLVTTIAFLMGAVGLISQARAADTDLARLSWLEGLWAGSKDGIEMEERWSSTNGGALLGIHKDVKNGRMVSYEFFRIDTTKDGAFYFASPRAAPPTPFKLVASAERSVTFENKEHDFPQRILYWLDADGALHARIEGRLNGKDLAEEWVWMRAAR